MWLPLLFATILVLCYVGCFAIDGMSMLVIPFAPIEQEDRGSCKISYGQMVRGSLSFIVLAKVNVSIQLVGRIALNPPFGALRTTRSPIQPLL